MWIFSRFYILQSASTFRTLRNTLFLVITIKTSGVSGKTCPSSCSICTIFLPPYFPIPLPLPPSSLSLSYPYLTTLLRGRVGLGCGRRSRDTAPHCTPTRRRPRRIPARAGHGILISRGKQASRCRRRAGFRQEGRDDEAFGTAAIIIARMHAHIFVNEG